MFFRSKDVEWVNFLTTRFVDDITNHLKIYRKAKQRVEKSAGLNTFYLLCSGSHPCRSSKKGSI